MSWVTVCQSYSVLVFTFIYWYSLFYWHYLALFSLHGRSFFLVYSWLSSSLFFLCLKQLRNQNFLISILQKLNHHHNLNNYVCLSSFHIALSVLSILSKITGWFFFRKGSEITKKYKPPQYVYCMNIQHSRSSKIQIFLDVRDPFEKKCVTRHPVWI